MTENDIKELISRNFIRTVANRQGYKVGDRDLDHGVDLSVIEVTKRKTNDGSIRYLDSGRQIELQLKCTTETGVTYTDESIKYALEVKTYNDLIYRKNNAIPLILVLFVLPSDVNKWVLCNDKMLKIQKHAFWYIPNALDTETENISNITIEIDKKNLVTKDSIKELFDIIYS
jgi:hypothetical protein